ncbi:MAG: hypothetical protein C0511_18990 [Hyphomicrobium sp.]|nr:hypothetical protein [Erythrobacter sp.]MBA4081035.1 hypothetical protein [Erythrobacter sp.]MBA4174675.1 hypothetical protein [Hyphomicrobium sp.]
MTSATTSRAAAALLALACGGCVASAPVPKGAVFGPQFAEATFELGLADTVGFGVASTQEYRVGPSAEFEEAGVVKIFTWAAKKPTPHLLEAGKPVVVFAKMNRMTGAPGITSSSDAWCINRSRFTPAPATRYRVVQRGIATEGCALSVVETETGRAPAGLEVIPFLRTNPVG